MQTFLDAAAVAGRMWASLVAFAKRLSMPHDEHSKHCHCVCTDLFDLQEAIEKARAIHTRYTPNKNCLMCGNTDGSCVNCAYLKDCIVCGDVWPCDTFIALDYGND